MMTRAARWAVAISMAAGLVIHGGTAGAQDASCSDVTVGAGGVELLTRGPTSIGPVAISLPAGTYRLVMSSTDPAHMPGFQGDQTNERWNFVLDNGYASPITPDLPTDQTSATYDMGVADLAAASSLTFVHHGVPPSADSVFPSVTFQCVTPPPTTAAPTTVPVTPAPSVSVLDTSTTAPATTVPTTTVPTTAAPTTAAPTTAPPVSTGDVDSEELPRTGGTTNLFFVGVGLAAAGAVVLGASRRLNSLGVMDD